MRKALRIGARVLGGLIAFVVGLVALVLIAVQFKPVRSFGRDKLLEAVRGSIKGELYVEDLRWPSLDRIELYGISARDRQGVHVLSLATLTANLKLRPLLAGRVEIEKLDVDHLYVDLADLGDQSGLLSLFASDEPAPPEPKKEDPNADMSPVAVAIDSLCLSETNVEVQPQAERALSLRRFSGCLEFAIGRDLRVALKGLEAELRQNGERVLTIEKDAALPQLAAAQPAPDPKVALPAPAVIAQPAAADDDTPPKSRGKRAQRAQKAAPAPPPAQAPSPP